MVFLGTIRPTNQQFLPQEGAGKADSLSAHLNLSTFKMTMNLSDEL